jgi:spermidine synthase
MTRLVAVLVFAGAAFLALGGYRLFHIGTSEPEVTLATNQGRDVVEAPFRGLTGYGEIERSVKSEYSTILIRKLGNTRTLSFVRDSGEEVVESMVDLQRPYDLLVPYTRCMFLSYLFLQKQERVLIVGLGGGSMIHFLKHYDPSVKVDVVEIDPAIVEIADKYFRVRSGGNVNIITKDAFEYLRTTDSQYDVVYMDAFLKPAADTDPTGVPLRLKTIEFYKGIQKKLKPDGLVVFNINPHPMIRDDVSTVRDAFPQSYAFDIANSEGLVVVGSLAPARVEGSTLATRAKDADRRFRTSFSFRDMARRLVAE